jgi:hypothetical protein
LPLIALPPPAPPALIAPVPPRKPVPPRGLGAESVVAQVGAADLAAIGDVAVIRLALTADLEVGEDVEALRLQVAEAAGQRRALLLRVPVLRRAEGDVRREAPVVAPQDDVDDAGDRIRAVDRRAAVLEDLDPIDRIERDQVEVGEHLLAVVGQAVRRDPPAVQQDERRCGAEAAQRDARSARSEAGAGSLRHRALVVDCERLQVLGDAGPRRLLDLFARHRRHRRCGLGVDAADVRSGDLDALERLRRRRRSRLCERGGTGAEQHAAGGQHQCMAELRRPHSSPPTGRCSRCASVRWPVQANADSVKPS